jgi:hypothetical protein
MPAVFSTDHLDPNFQTTISAFSLALWTFSLFPPAHDRPPPESTDVPKTTLIPPAFDAVHLHGGVAVFSSISTNDFAFHRLLDYPLLVLLSPDIALLLSCPTAVFGSPVHRPT